MALLVSCAVYLITWITRFNLTAGRGIGDWYFNPFAWQLLYTIGMVVFHLSKTAPEFIPWKGRWLGLSIVLIVFGLVSAAVWKGGGLTLLHTGVQLWPANKTFLAPLRILNVLALAYVFAFLVPSQAPGLRSRLAVPLLQCGQHSLTVYGAGVLLSCIAYVVTTEAGATRTVALLVDFAGITTMFVLAAFLEAYRESRGRAVPQAVRESSPRQLRGRAESFSLVSETRCKISGSY